MDTPWTFPNLNFRREKFERPGRLAMEPFCGPKGKHGSRLLLGMGVFYSTVKRPEK
jgi:hypothetical protein